jgi:hypothetical protein
MRERERERERENENEKEKKEPLGPVLQRTERFYERKEKIGRLSFLEFALWFPIHIHSCSFMSEEEHIKIFVDICVSGELCCVENSPP